MLLRKSLVLILLFLSFQSFGQFWFGVKSGVNLINQVYQEKGYTDRYDPKDNLINWNIGGVLNYTTSEKYSIHTELLYERVDRRIDDVRNSPDSIIARSDLKYHFLSAPIMFRIQFGRTPIRYYVNAGPQIRMWLSGKGTITADELFENGDTNKRNFSISFKDPADEPADNTYFVPNPNRIQYAFVIGGGVVLDLFNKSQRLMIDGRFIWGHSIMGFNRGTESSQLSVYGENFEFSDNTISISLAYLFGFDPMDVRKGSSTIKAKKLK